MRALLALLLLTGCAEPQRPVAPPGPWSVVHRAFGASFFDATARGPLLAPEAAQALVLPGLIDAARYRYLQVSELRRVDPDRRVGTVAFAIDEWPAALDVELVRAGGAWRITQISPPSVQRALLDLLGPDGLPAAAAAEPWAGGLAGRDAAGRPTAAVLVLGQEEDVWVDGAPLAEPEPPAVVAAIRQALEARKQLADEAHATYRPQVAIALPRHASPLRHRLLADQALEAGAEVLLLVVRGERGRPAVLPLARRGPVPPGPRRPPVLTLAHDLAGVAVALGEARVDIPHLDGAIDRNGLGAALTELGRTRPEGLAGARLLINVEADHGLTVALLDVLRRALPDLPVVTEAP